MRATPGGGRTRAELLDRVAYDSILMLANVTLLVDGVANCLQIAAARNNAVNHPALSATVRPAVETAGQLAWLLDDSIDGADRGRRYLIWRFSDLRHQRHVLSDFRSGADEAAAVAELDDLERELVDLAEGAKWDVRSTVKQANGDVTAAALLDRLGAKPEPMPKITELIRKVSSTPSLYSLLSVPAHGRRFGVLHGIQQQQAPDPQGKAELLVGGFGLPPNLCIGLASLSIDVPSRLLAGWNGIDASALHRSVVELMHRAGLA